MFTPISCLPDGARIWAVVRRHTKHGSVTSSVMHLCTKNTANGKRYFTALIPVCGATEGRPGGEPSPWFTICRSCSKQARKHRMGLDDDLYPREPIHVDGPNSPWVMAHGSIPLPQLTAAQASAVVARSLAARQSETAPYERLVAAAQQLLNAAEVIPTNTLPGLPSATMADPWRRTITRLMHEALLHGCTDPALSDAARLHLVDLRHSLQRL